MVFVSAGLIVLVCVVKEFRSSAHADAPESPEQALAAWHWETSREMRVLGWLGLTALVLITGTALTSGPINLPPLLLVGLLGIAADRLVRLMGSRRWGAAAAVVYVVAASAAVISTS